jgi:zinc protease
VPFSKKLVALDIISDIITQPIFDHKMFDKEKKVVLEEIKMVKDQPLLYQWVLLESTLFKKHPTRFPVYGNVEAIERMTREDMISYYKKWYTPHNMILCIVGDCSGIKQAISSRFGAFAGKPVDSALHFQEPKDKRPTVKKEKKDTNQAYLLIAYKTIPRLHKDSYALDLLSAVFSKGISGRITEEIRLKRGLAYSVGTMHDSKKDFGFFVTYLNCDRKNLELCKKLVFEQFRKIDDLSAKELSGAKDHLVGRSLLENEDSHRRADDLAFWESIKDVKLADSYCRSIMQVTKKDIIHVRDSYFKNHTLVVISK